MNETTITTYAGNFIYQQLSGQSAAELKLFSHPEGYTEIDRNTGAITYVYQYKDHLGNIRLTYADSDKNGSIDSSTEIIEEHNYYPFGLEHKGYNDIVSANVNSMASKFKYNETELEENLGLDLYEMPFRHFDNALGRFTSVDEMAESAFDYTPYRFGFNNPIFFSDPSGLWEEVKGGYSTTDSDEIQRVLGYLTSRGDTDSSIDGITNFIKEDIAWMKEWGEGLRLSTAISNQNGLTEHSVHRIQNEVAYYQRKTDYIYTREDYEMRNKILTGSWDPIETELRRRESMGWYQPITAKNYIKYVGDERSARMLTFSSFLNEMSLGPGPKSISRNVKPRYLGKTTNEGTLASKSKSISILGNRIQPHTTKPQNMSFKEFVKNYSHHYRGKFRGRGTYLKFMSMDFQMLKKGL